MNESHHELPEAIIVEQEVRFSFIELQRACSSSEAQLRALVDEGVLEPRGAGPGDWVFDGGALRTARTALRLSRDLALTPEATATVLELLTEIESLRAQLRRAGMR